MTTHINNFKDILNAETQSGALTVSSKFEVSSTRTK